MNVLSLFDGISGAQLALYRSQIHVDNYFSSEIDKYAIQITQKNFPKTIQLGSILDWKKWNLPKIDLIVAGSPCQGFSFAGKQLNFGDERSKLFFNFVDVLENYKPDYFILENVKMKKTYQDKISEILFTEPIEINSSLVSAQNRKRLYWCNFPVSVPVDKKIYLSGIIDDGFVDREKSYCIDANYYKGGSLENYIKKSRRQIVYTKNLGVGYRHLNVVECERLQTFTEGYTKGISRTQAIKLLGNSFTVDVICHILNCINSSFETQSMFFFVKQ